MLSLLKGLVIGFSIAAPVGPIGLLCLRRSLNEGRLAGFVTGLGAASADAMYGAVAALGLTAVTAALLEHGSWLQVAGGIFLLYLGWTTARQGPLGAAEPNADPSSAIPATSLLRAYGSTFLLTLTNPLTIISFAGIFAGAGLVEAPGSAGASVLLVAGVFFGSAAWWLFLSSLAGAVGARLSVRGLRGVNRLAGLLLAALGAWQLLEFAGRA